MNLGVELVNITFRYDEATEPLFRRLSCRFPAGWTGVVGANGAGKTTLLKLATGLLAPRAGQASLPGPALYGEQRTDHPPAELAAFLQSRQKEAHRVRGVLQIGEDWLERWSTLSHGERKRAQVAVLLWKEPVVLALDEPTNHLDQEARRLLTVALRGFRGVGLLVSHDRELLDGLCERCLFIDPPAAVLRPGGYSDGAKEAARERKTLLRQREIARRHRRRLERETTRRRSEAEKGEKKGSKSRLDRKDKDGRAKIDLARLTGKDGGAARRVKQMEERAAEARQAEEGIRVRKEYETGIGLPGERSPRNFLLRLAASSVPLGRRVLRHPDLAIAPDDRIALVGPNGAGKSTLVEKMIASLELPEHRLVYVPQEIDVTRSAEILDDARSLPREILGRMMNVVSRLGSRPARLLESDTPTPGEVRKLLLATGAAREPWMIVLDEPTNHMDLPSVECLEEALAGFPGALLLVSHDHRFLRSLTDKVWDLSLEEEGVESLVLKERGWD